MRVTEFGYVEPVIWNKRSGNVIGGHQRLTVMKNLGYTEVDCVIVDLDDMGEKALNIALNKIQGEWDRDKLSAFAGHAYKFVKRLSKQERKNWGYAGIWEMTTVRANNGNS